MKWKAATWPAQNISSKYHLPQVNNEYYHWFWPQKYLCHVKNAMDKTGPLWLRSDKLRDVALELVSQM